MEQFAKNIKDLEVTTVDRARQAIADKETATFFVGRKTCPYCRKFAATLAGVVADTCVRDSCCENVGLCLQVLRHKAAITCTTTSYLLAINK